MPTSKTHRTVRLGLLGLAAAALMILTAPTAEARPAYKKAFDATYEVNEKVSCNTCHGKSKKMLSTYGLDLKDVMGEKNIKDQDQIVEALKAVESKGDVEGKTYGELLSAGEVPPPYVAE